MSDAVAWSAILLPVIVASVLAGRLSVLRRREAELGWQLAAQRESRAVETEQRLRSEHAAELARTIHDDLGHRLTLTSIQAAALRTRAGADLAPDLEQLRASVEECVEALNRSVSGLGAEVDGSDVEHGIDEIATAIARTGTSVEVDASDVDDPTSGSPLSPATATTVVTVVREAGTNALRHAAGAPILIRVRRDRDAIVVDVDNGAADAATGRPALPSGGHGLQGLAARVQGLGGSLDAGPSGDGWRLHARLPIQVTTEVDEARRLLVRQRRRTRRLLLTLPAATVALAVAIPLGAVVGQAALSRVSPADFAAIAVGDSEDSALSRLPAVEMESPPPPVGSGSCRHYEASLSLFERTEVYEVCFAQGRVTSTTIIPAP